MRRFLRGQRFAMLSPIKARTLALFSILLTCIPGSASTLLFESGSFGGPSNGGFLLFEGQFVRARFKVSQTENITAVGGNLGSFPGSAFSALVELNGSGFPAGAPTALEPLAMTTFSAGNPYHTSDVSVPLSVMLTPGSYGLVFGGGLFGATGGGTMAMNNPQLPNAGYFYYTDMLGDTWLPITENFRFTVYGNAVIPEPSLFGLVGAACLLLASSKYRGRKNTKPRPAFVGRGPFI